MRTLSRLTAPIVFTLFVAGCALSTHPSIAELKYNPGRFQDRSVEVTGRVTTSWGVPMVPVKLYRVDDGTGEMTVFARDGRVPARGSRVTVRGRVSQVGTFGGQSIGLHLEQEHIKFRDR